MYIKESLGTSIAFGFEGNEREVEKFETLCHNYSISEKPHRLYPNFSYVIARPEKLLAGLTLFFQNGHIAKGECKAGGYRILAIHEARKLINNAKFEPFYSLYIETQNRLKERIESVFNKNQGFVLIGNFSNKSEN